MILEKNVSWLNPMEKKTSILLIEKLILDLNVIESVERCKTKMFFAAVNVCK